MGKFKIIGELIKKVMGKSTHSSKSKVKPKMEKVDNVPKGKDKAYYGEIEIEQPAEKTNEENDKMEKSWSNNSGHENEEQDFKAAKEENQKLPSKGLKKGEYYKSYPPDYRPPELPEYPNYEDHSYEDDLSL